MTRRKIRFFLKFFQLFLYFQDTPNDHVDTFFLSDSVTDITGRDDCFLRRSTQRNGGGGESCRSVNRLVSLALHFVVPSVTAQSLFLSYDLPPESSLLKVDQFGYLSGSLFKVAVISNPQVGFNSLDSFTLSTDDQEFEVREWTTNRVVFSGPLQVWQNGDCTPVGRFRLVV